MSDLLMSNAKAASYEGEPFTITIHLLITDYSSLIILFTFDDSRFTFIIPFSNYSSR